VIFFFFIYLIKKFTEFFGKILLFPLNIYIDCNLALLKTLEICECFKDFSNIYTVCLGIKSIQSEGLKGKSPHV